MFIKKVFHEVAGVKIVDRNRYNKAPKHVHKIPIKWVTETDQLYNMVDILEKMFDNSQSSKEKAGTLNAQKLCLTYRKIRIISMGRQKTILCRK